MTTSTARWTFTAEAREQLEALLAAEPCDEEWYQLRRTAEELAVMPGFDRLIALDQNRIQELPHQIDVAQRVLGPPMRGRAVLADEVGLGKTIEAGLIYKELAVRGLARRVLIVAPASLVGQWQAELETKFLEKFATPTAATHCGSISQRPRQWELQCHVAHRVSPAHAHSSARSLTWHRNRSGAAQSMRVRICGRSAS